MDLIGTSHCRPALEHRQDKFRSGWRGSGRQKTKISIDWVLTNSRSAPKRLCVLIGCRVPFDAEADRELWFFCRSVKRRKVEKCQQKLMPIPAQPVKPVSILVQPRPSSATTRPLLMGLSAPIAVSVSMSAPSKLSKWPTSPPVRSRLLLRLVDTDMLLGSARSALQRGC